MTELDIIRFIQSFQQPLLDNFFELITMLGESTVIISIILGIYWCLDKRRGECIAYAFFTSSLLNNTLKNIFKAKRPIGEEGVRSLRVHTATGYSFPSGHSQGAAATYGVVCLIYRKHKLAVILLLIPLLVGLSRLYLGVHYPKDVIAGIILGSITCYITYKLFTKVKNKQLLYLITLIIFLPSVFNSSADFSKSIGTFIGFTIGTWFEANYVNFHVNIKLYKKIIRFIIGIVLIIIVKILFSYLSLQSDYLKFMKESILSFLGFGLYPYMFSKFIELNRTN